MSNKQQFDDHANKIGLKVNEYFACIINEGSTMSASFMLTYPDKPIVRVEYYVGNKTGSFNIPLDTFLTTNKSDIVRLKSELAEKNTQYDQMMFKVKTFMPRTKSDLKSMFHVS